MKNRVLENWLPLRAWWRAIKLHVQGLWLRLFPRKTLEKQIKWLREQNNELHEFQALLRQERLVREANIRNLNERLLKEHGKNKKLIAGIEILQTRCAELIETLRELERDREVWVEKTQAHRDARRKICEVLNDLGKKDSFSEPDPKPQPNYRVPTVEDLMQGPFPVEVSKDGITWGEFYLVEITDDSHPFVCVHRVNQSEPHRYFRFARVLDTGTKPNA